MKKGFLFLISLITVVFTFAQDDLIKANTGTGGRSNFTVIKQVPATPVKNQAMTGTCWSFSTTSLVESQALKNNLGEFDLSEMFTVRNIYMEKARNYILRQGHAQFGEGGLGHNQILAIATYGAMPESVYSGLKPGQKSHNHQKLVSSLQSYLDSLLKHIPIAANWMDGFVKILDDELGKPPAKFDYNGKTYTAQSFAKTALQFNANDYVFITSFTHHPFYEPFVLEVPDNFSNGAYINVPLDEMIQLTKDAITGGYSVLWDADVSNTGFMQGRGIAGLYDTSINSMRTSNRTKAKALAEKEKNKKVESADAAMNTNKPVESNKDAGNAKVNEKIAYSDGTKEEVVWDADLRQALFENLTTQDDHLMHITGLERSKAGKDFFIVKNSWGKVGPDDGYINVSEGYFAINTLSLVVPKAAFSKAMLEKLKIK
ncbi:MAG: C1 family peptidase [Ferruginibacter sp.]